MGYPRYVFFVDVEGTKDVKQMITLLAITSQFIPQNRRGSERLRKQMLINTHKVNRCERRLQDVLTVGSSIKLIYKINSNQVNANTSNIGIFRHVPYLISSHFCNVYPKLIYGDKLNFLRINEISFCQTGKSQLHLFPLKILFRGCGRNKKRQTNDKFIGDYWSIFTIKKTWILLTVPSDRKQMLINAHEVNRC